MAYPSVHYCYERHLKEATRGTWCLRVRMDWRLGPKIQTLYSADALGNFATSPQAPGSATDLLSCPKPNQPSTFLHAAHRERLGYDVFKDLWCQMKRKGKGFIKIFFQGREPRGNDGRPQPQDVIALVIFTVSLILKILISKSFRGYHTFEQMK